MRFEPKVGDTVTIELVTGTKLTLRVTDLLRRGDPIGVVTFVGVSNGTATMVATGTIATLKIVKEAAPVRPLFTAADVRQLSRV